MQKNSLPSEPPGKPLRLCFKWECLNLGEVKWASQVALVVKNPPVNARDIRDVGLIPGQEDPPEEGMTTHSSILAWRIPWTEEFGQPQSIGLRRVAQD